MKNTFLAGVLLATVMGSGIFAFGADKAKTAADKKMEPSADQRRKMAEAHEKMAACLRSDKAFEECHKEMMGKDGCQMKGKEMSHHGMMRHDHDASEE